jgi:hypothetical protein
LRKNLSCVSDADNVLSPIPDVLRLATFLRRLRRHRI